VSAVQQPLGMLLCDDLIFASRIAGEARAQGVTIKAARSAEVLEQMAREQAPSCVVLDLALAGPVIADVVKRLRTGMSPRIIAYGSHVDTATLRAAREAGCDVVLPRSKFVEELPRAIADWARATASGPNP
jgi:CheY-like chemotaxis protein